MSSNEFARSQSAALLAVVLLMEICTHALDMLPSNLNKQQLFAASRKGAAHSSGSEAGQLKEVTMTVTIQSGTFMLCDTILSAN